MIDRAQFIADAWKLEGVPFLHQGTDPAIGLDCIHVPLFLFQQQGVVLPIDVPNTYRRNAHDTEAIENALNEWCTPVGKTEARAGDLYLSRPAIRMRHIGVQLTNDSPPLILQASSEARPGFPNGRLTVEPFADRWLRICRGVYRPPFFD